MDSTAARRTCFIEEDDGLASLAADMEAGVSGNNHHHHHQQYPLLSRPLYYNIAARSQRRGSLRSFPFSSSSVSSPRSVGRFYDAGRYEEYQQPHFLDACFLCKKPLASNKDIFMYRGDTPFCSEECRQEQMEMDEAKEKNWNLSSIKALRKEQKKSKSTSPNKTKDYPFRPSTVAAA